MRRSVDANVDHNEANGNEKSCNLQTRSLTMPSTRTQFRNLSSHFIHYVSSDSHAGQTSIEFLCTEQIHVSVSPFEGVTVTFFFVVQRNAIFSATAAATRERCERAVQAFKYLTEQGKARVGGGEKGCLHAFNILPYINTALTGANPTASQSRRRKSPCNVGE